MSFFICFFKMIMLDFIRTEILTIILRGREDFEKMGVTVVADKGTANERLNKGVDIFHNVRRILADNLLIEDVSKIRLGTKISELTYQSGNKNIPSQIPFLVLASREIQECLGSSKEICTVLLADRDFTVEDLIEHFIGKEDWATKKTGLQLFWKIQDIFAEVLSTKTEDVCINSTIGQLGRRLTRERHILDPSCHLAEAYKRLILYISKEWGIVPDLSSINDRAKISDILEKLQKQILTKKL